MKLNIDVSELRELSRTLIKDAPDQAIAAGRAATIEEARLIKSRARSAAPKDRPWLSGAIHQKSWKNPNSVATNVFVEAEDPEGRRVAFYVEYGTSKAAPQPFMGPAIAPSQTSYPAAVLAKIDFFGAAPSAGSGDE